MIKPDTAQNEKERLHALKEYQILDTIPEEDLDNITKLASEICQTPISLISLIDESRQWFKSKQGLETEETPREFAFCAHAINNPGELMVVPDSRLDERFHDNPLVIDNPNVVFYTGVPLVNPDGYSLGTLCIIDNKPRNITESQKEALRILGKQVIRLFELRKTNIELEKARRILETRNNDLKEFASVVSHDIRSPLSTIISSIELLQLSYTDKLEAKGHKILGFIQESADKLKNMVEGILDYYRSDPITLRSAQKIKLYEFFIELKEMIKEAEDVAFSLPEGEIMVNKSAMTQIFLNLITNGIRYNDKKNKTIDIQFTEDKDSYQFTVSDNGMGIEEEDIDGIFEIFKTVKARDPEGKPSTGIGLSTVKKILNNMHGSVKVESEPGTGSRFIVKMKKT